MRYAQRRAVKGFVIALLGLQCSTIGDHDILLQSTQCKIAAFG